MGLLYKKLGDLRNVFKVSNSLHQREVSLLGGVLVFLGVVLLGAPGNGDGRHVEGEESFSLEGVLGGMVRVGRGGCKRAVFFVFGGLVAFRGGGGLGGGQVFDASDYHFFLSFF